MSARKVVLITDYAWPNVDREREILGTVGASIMVAKTGDKDELVQLAPSAHGILCNWKLLSRSVLEAAVNCVAVGRYELALTTLMWMRRADSALW